MTTERPIISAPGKLFLIGEYAVLHGHPAIVAAVDRRVTGRFISGGAPATPLVQSIVDVVRNYLLEDGGTPPDGAPLLDSSALASSTGKLGLGSSAAVAAAGVGALLDAAGCDLEYTQTLALMLAHRAHRAAQGGRGSGADVAAAIYGGIISYRRQGQDVTVQSYRRQGQDVTVQPVELPNGVELVVFSTGTPSSTVDHVRALEVYAKEKPEPWSARLTEIGAVARNFTAACVDDAAPGIFEAVTRANVLLDLLGREMGLPIVTPALAEAAKLAADLGGAAKPSGAGGGDVGVAFLTDEKAAETFRARASHLGLEILSIRTGADGLRREPSGPERNHVV
jgi:ERG8-type phosphomevalonate kinase